MYQIKEAEIIASARQAVNQPSSSKHWLEDYSVFAAPAAGPRNFCTLGFETVFLSAFRGGLISQQQGRRW